MDQYEKAGEEQDAYEAEVEAAMAAESNECTIFH